MQLVIIKIVFHVLNAVLSHVAFPMSSKRKGRSEINKCYGCSRQHLVTPLIELF